MTTFHPAFQCHGRSFKTPAMLCAFVREVSEESADFLEVWFDEKGYVEVQTSGSTGNPKRIRLHKSHMVNSAMSTGSYFNLGPGTKALLCLSTHFIAGKMMWVRALELGWDLDIAKNYSQPLHDENSKYDFVAMVPLQVQQSLVHLNRVQKLIVGGGVVSPQLRSCLQSLTTEVFATYGMTETITHIAVQRLNHTKDEHRVLYEALPSVKLSTDDRGCLVIDAAFVSEAMVITNDIVELYSKTSFRWVGRFDSIVNSGGVKLQPEAIEAKLAKVLDGCFMICGIPDERLGEKLVLIVEGSGAAIDAKEAIKTYLMGANLEKYEFPKVICFVAVFVRTETGKIQRAKTLEKCGVSS